MKRELKQNQRSQISHEYVSQTSDKTIGTIKNSLQPMCNVVRLDTMPCYHVTLDSIPTGKKYIFEQIKNNFY